MNPLLLLAAIMVLPLLVAGVMRVNSALLFLGIASGFLLQYVLGDSTAFTLDAMIRGPYAEQIAHFGLLGIPVLLCCIFLRKTVKRRSQVLQFLPLVLACAAFAALSIPLLTPGLQGSLHAQPLWPTINQASDVIVALAAATNLLLALRVFRHREEAHGKKH